MVCNVLDTAPVHAGRNPLPDSGRPDKRRVWLRTSQALSAYSQVSSLSGLTLCLQRGFYIVYLRTFWRT